MAASNLNLALIIKNPSDDALFLLLKRTPPPKFGEDEYDSYVDSDLWDLPSAELNAGGEGSECGIVVGGLESLPEKFNPRNFDIDKAIYQLLGQVGLEGGDVKDWRFFKFVEEADFGPGLPVHTVYILGKLVSENRKLTELCKWMSIQSCLTLLLDVKLSNDRMGPLIVAGLINNSVKSSEWKAHTTLHYQEYPPGVVLVPMKSRTRHPFHTTTLVVFAPESVTNECDNYSFVAKGDALIVDPGCRANSHAELAKIVAALPKKLVVFITHHHHDHVDGLSVIQKCNPDAILIAHENTMRRVGKGDWSLGYTSVSGGEDLCIGGQQLSVIFAPGHTDGHIALLHVSTRSLIIGDHCVGQGSAVLDVTAGGNMTDYFQSTYKFIELSPHVLIPMHGRVNLWPKNMLCKYLKNRRSREASILKAIQNGAKTLFDIISHVYGDVDPSLWIPASSNVRLHVDHLAQQNKLPKEFSVRKFRLSLLDFILRWILASLFSYFSKMPNLTKFAIAGAVGCIAIFFYSIQNNLISK